MARTSRPMSEPDDAEPLPEFLTGLIQQLEEGLLEPKSAPSANALARMLASLERRVNEFITSPVDPLVALFNAVLAATLALYSELGIEMDERFGDDVSFEVRNTTQDDPRSTPRPHLVMARTHFLDESKPSSKVMLRLIQIKNFDLADALSVPYVLFHECVSHVAQGPWNDRRPNPEAGSHFAEGWMDLVAYHFHAAMLEGRGVKGEFSSTLDAYSPSCVVEATKCHDARYAPIVGNRQWSTRSRGRAAAQQLLKRVLRLLPETKDQAEAELWRLSAALNVSDIPHIDRDTFAKQIDLATRDDVDGDLRETQRAQLTRLIKDYVVDHDVHRLVDRVMHLTS